MIASLHALLLALLFAAVHAQAAGLPDTGQDTCYDDTAADGVAASNAGSIALDAGSHPRQDCRYGRDVAAAAGALARTGTGPKGFDYTRIGNNGEDLAANAPPGAGPAEWACTRDNVTGLTWEVKTAGSTDLRYFGHGYTWYSTDGSTNGGVAGNTASTTCDAAARGSPCNTEGFASAVNAAALCGHADWRMPTQRELLSLVSADGSSPAIAGTWFPNTPANFHWSGTSSARTVGYAWTVDFMTGHTTASSKTSNTPRYVRLVRGGAPDNGTACTAANPLAGATESTPTAAFTIHGDGTLTHQLTGLMWKQCPQGLSGAGCATGTAAALTWRGALMNAVADTSAGYHDWRLPNKKELESIVEFCGSGPAINQVVFPAVSTRSFWTGTTHLPFPSDTWIVGFDSGYSGADAKSSTNNLVRLVRGGRAYDSYDALQKRTVVEYLNTGDFPDSPGGHFFYSSDPAEQAAVDAGAAGQFTRTGRQFLTGGTQPVCRFYGSMTPGPNSHFFTVEADECNALIAAQVTPRPPTVQQWNFEGASYATTPAAVAANGARTCPANTLPLYRAYNNAYPPSGPKNPWDSNHRFTPALSDIAAMVAGGWRDEGLVFCTTQ
ncbi:MAG: DUF1566 domain-containing protein [Betaproteobacteria bacterium]|nr:DUF1566 domain-containing protein [Betaproteobacteria bacterium]